MTDRTDTDQTPGGFTAIEWMTALFYLADGNTACYEIRDKTGLPRRDCESLALWRGWRAANGRAGGGLAFRRTS